jgi:hypothetical protein
VQPSPVVEHASTRTSASPKSVRAPSPVLPAQTDIDRWITCETHTSNTFTVQAVDSADNRSPMSSLTLDNQTSRARPCSPRHNFIT